VENPTRSEVHKFLLEQEDKGRRTLAIAGVRSALLQIVKIESAKRDMTAREWVVESILKNSQGEY